ncbi:MAG: DUF2807 domain-containing protein [Flammeovirgaceae bacterium]|nr:DUF2807 domain-containing protein [Flammeovirgaceae bacterium]
MKKTIIFSLFLLVLSLPVWSQKKETRNVSGYNEISFRVPGKLYLKQGNAEKVELEGKAETLEKIETRVEGGKLIIGSKENWFNWNWGDDDKIIAYIMIKNVEGLSVSGSGDLIAQTVLTGNDMELKVSGSGSLKAEVEVTGKIEADVSGSGDLEVRGKCKNIDSSVSGSGDVTANLAIAGDADFNVSGSGKIIASGSSQEVEAKISGSGKVLAADLVTNKCEVRISGSGDVEINVKEELDATIAGSGDVRYKGEPKRVNANASGSGSVKKM